MCKKMGINNLPNNYCVFCGRTPKESKSLHVSMRIGGRKIYGCGDCRKEFKIKPRLTSVFNTKVGDYLVKLRTNNTFVQDDCMKSSIKEMLNINVQR